ncbi:DAPG hydrolase family protein [Aestuariivirga litoralis]|uniref:DAPG hydrolase family protein n=1 Tax=Aestuariivirga litoralis TaxID=2650924 RepID=UPI0018C71C0C|nr:hypothetical protein [Aestuariivirga litoralis]MBG1233264.1 hypothetical protein [Aestuariivirga litoralis]
MRYEEINDLLKPGYLPIESGVVSYDDGFKTVCALARMPRCKAKMIEWWFRYLGGTEQYKLWHPVDHLFSDWEGRVPGTHVGSSHLVHEYLAGPDGPVYKLRINFRDPLEFFDKKQYGNFTGAAICARIGDLDHPINFGKMVHFVRNTDQGCEMRSRFFLGIFESRVEGETFSEEQKLAMRKEMVTPELARRLHQHCTEEMAYLAEILPIMYRQVTGDIAA